MKRYESRVMLNGHPLYSRFREDYTDTDDIMNFVSFHYEGYGLFCIDPDGLFIYPFVRPTGFDCSHRDTMIIELECDIV
jgi:hypothetical protein